MARLFVNASVVDVGEAEATKAAEALSRVMTGLALEGMTCTITVSTMEDEPE